MIYNISTSVTNGSYTGDTTIYYGNTASVTISASTGYKLPDSISVSGATYSYDKTTGVISLSNPTSNVTISATCPTEAFDPTAADWYNHTDACQESDIGCLTTISINGVEHHMRLIGIDHDTLADGTGTAHTTWEFANLLSDQDGYSLATFWKRGDSSMTSQDYLNSSIYKCMEGEGTDGIYWYRKASATTVASDDPNYQKTVWDMLPPSLQSKIKQVKKSIGIGTSYTETTYNCKLFNLSCIEMGFSSTTDKGYGTTYTYYYSSTSKSDTARIKKQVNNAVAYTTETTITDSDYSNAKNHAGYNVISTLSPTVQGGRYWLRSPRSNFSYTVWNCLDAGLLDSDGVYSDANGVAPAFCI